MPKLSQTWSAWRLFSAWRRYNFVVNIEYCVVFAIWKLAGLPPNRKDSCFKTWLPVPSQVRQEIFCWRIWTHSLVFARFGWHLTCLVSHCACTFNIFQSFHLERYSCKFFEPSHRHAQMSLASGLSPNTEHADRCHSNSILYKLGSDPWQKRLQKPAKHRVPGSLSSECFNSYSSAKLYSKDILFKNIRTITVLFVGLAIARKKGYKRDMTSTVMQCRDAQRQQGQSRFDLWSPCFEVFLEQFVSFGATSFLRIYGHLAIRIVSSSTS